MFLFHNQEELSCTAIYRNEYESKYLKCVSFNPSSISFCCFWTLIKFGKFQASEKFELRVKLMLKFLKNVKFSISAEKVKSGFIYEHSFNDFLIMHLDFIF